MATSVGLSDVVRDQMLTDVGLSLTTPLKAFAAVTPADVESLLASMVITADSSRPLAIGEKGAINAFFLDSCSLFVPPVPPPVAATIVPPAAQPPALPIKTTVSHSAFVSQIDPSESVPLTHDEHGAYI